MSSRYIVNTVMKDNETRLIIPSKDVILRNLISGVITSFTQSYANATGSASQVSLQVAINSILNGPLLTLGVTEIRVKGKMIVPRTKGIGSVGEILHLIGSENEKVTLKFTTDRYPGPIASVLHDMLKLTLEAADLVYVVDDLLTVAPCIMLDYDLSKIGNLKEAVIGELKLEILNTLGLTGVSGLAYTFLKTLSVSAITNFISTVEQPFQWIGTFVQEKRVRG